MKTIYLLRHAKSSWADETLADIDRPLNKRGKEAAKAVAAYMEETDIRPDLILCSAAKRTRSTLKPIQKTLKPDVPVIVDQSLYGAEAPELLRRLRAVDNGAASVLLIGHNPAMENLARRLSGGGDPDALTRMAIKFSTAALAVFQADIGDWRDLHPGGATLVSFTTGRDLAA